VALQKVLENIRAKIADMRAAINRRSTGIEVDLVRRGVARRETLELSRVSIKEAQRHALEIFNKPDRDRRDAFAMTDSSESFVGGCLDVHA